MKTLFIFCVTFLSMQFAMAQAPMSITQKQPIAYDLVDVKPQFKGGINEFMKYFMSNYQVPEEDGPVGLLQMSFEINTSGKVENIKILKDVGKGAGKEATRVLLDCPNWTPGRQDGNTVSVVYLLPITLK